MADEYIGKENAIDVAKKYLGTIGLNPEILVDSFITMPPADVVPVRHGTWLPIVSYNNTYKCSECGRLLVDITDGLKMVAMNYPYCHCGARMVE